MLRLSSGRQVMRTLATVLAAIAISTTGTAWQRHRVAVPQAWVVALQPGTKAHAWAPAVVRWARRPDVPRHGRRRREEPEEAKAASGPGHSRSARIEDFERDGRVKASEKDNSAGNSENGNSRTPVRRAAIPPR